MSLNPAEPTFHRVLGENGAPAEKRMGGPSPALEMLLEDFSKNLTRGCRIRVSEIFASPGEGRRYLPVLIAYARCIKNGSGERQLFYRALLDLYLLAPRTVLALVPFIPSEDCLGTWKDFERIAMVIHNRRVLPHQKSQATTPNPALDQNCPCSPPIYDSRRYNELVDAMSEHHAQALLADDRSLASDPGARLSLAAKYASSEGGFGWKFYGSNTALRVYQLRHGEPPTSPVMAYKEYRQMLSRLRQSLGVVERMLCEGNLDEIDFSRVPSGAMRLYGRCTFRNLMEPAKSSVDPQARRTDDRWVRMAQRFIEHLAKAKLGEVKVNGGRLQVLQLATMLAGPPDDAVEAQARSFLDTMKQECAERASAAGERVTVDMSRIVAMCDVSGSMMSPLSDAGVMAIDVATVLGWIASQLASGPWCDLVMEFSETAAWVDLSTEGTHQAKYAKIRQAPWGMNTNFEAAIERILDRATNLELPPSELQGLTLLVSTDMQFDSAGDLSVSAWETRHETLRRRFAERGYPVPRVVYWNLAARPTAGFIVTHDIKGVVTMSGCGSSQIKDVLSGSELELTPLEHMLSVLNSEHFDVIHAAIAQAGEF